MVTPFSLIAAILGLACVYVVLPITVGTYRKFRTKMLVSCPDTGENATVELDARRAAVTSAIGNPELRVARCSSWPQRQHCRRECLRQIG